MDSWAFIRIRKGLNGLVKIWKIFQGFGGSFTSLQDICKLKDMHRVRAYKGFVGICKDLQRFYKD